MAVSGTKVARKEASKDQLVEHLKEHHDASVKHTELHHAHAALASKHEHNEGLSHAHHEASDYHLKAAHFHNKAFNAACSHHSDYDAYAEKAHHTSKVANGLSSRAHKAGGDHASLLDAAATKLSYHGEKPFTIKSKRHVSGQGVHIDAKESKVEKGHNIDFIPTLSGKHMWVHHHKNAHASVMHKMTTAAAKKVMARCK